MKTAFPLPPTVALPIIDSHTVVPVRRIYCVGKNYHAHAKEMGGTVSQDAPFFFLKTPQDIVLSGSTITYPSATQDLHFELELVVIVGKTLNNATLAEARDAIFGYAVGIDLTRRDMQQRLKEKSLPWALSKSFTNAAVISNITTDIERDTLEEARITLTQNGEIRQDACIGDMARSIEELLVYLSQLDTVEAGDILFTGTPAGVGAVNKGDTLHGTISGVGEIMLTIAP